MIDGKQRSEVLRTCTSRRLAERGVVVAAMLFMILCGPELSFAAPPGTGPTRACSAGGHSASRTMCVVMPARGTFTLPIPGTHAALLGAGAPDRAGHPITITRVNLLCPRLGGLGIQIRTPRSTGLLPPLRWSNGTLYAKNPASGQCTAIASPALAAAPGTYQVVPVAAHAGTTGSARTSGIVVMPRTGGGAGDTLPSHSPLIPVLLALFLTLLGVTRHARSR